MIGYTAQKKYFLEALNAGTLAHAYCLVGPEGVGKRTLANEVAASIFNVPVDKVPLNANYIYMARLEDEKTGKLKKEISVAQARELRARLSGSSWGGTWRVVVIDEAELLNTEAANALLKLLEEPPKNTIFFLLTTNDGLLLPTIQSRVQLLNLAPLSDAELAAALPEVNDDMLKLAWGRPGRARAFLHDSEKLAWYTEETKRWHDMRGAPLYAKIALIEKLYGDKDDAQRGREKLDEVLELWTMLARADMLAAKSDHTKLLDAIAAGRKMLGMNVHPRLIVENILLYI